MVICDTALRAIARSRVAGVTPWVAQNSRTAASYLEESSAEPLQASCFSAEGRSQFSDTDAWLLELTRSSPLRRNKEILLRSN